MKNKGYHQCRFKDNPMEKLFAQEWERINTSRMTQDLDGKGILDYMLAKDNNYPAGEATPRDREVAATIIQWLGSPVGQGFLEDVQKQAQSDKKED
jgi:hypothetical protein